MKFEFSTATRIHFGAGVLGEAGSLARAYGTRALVVTGRSAQRVEPLCRILREHGVTGVVFAVDGEPEIATIDRGVALARTEGCQMTIGFGGGSALDAAKAVAAMLANGGEVLDYVEIIGRGRVLTQPSVPFIAIPTTAGTGSEVTRNAVLGSPDHQLKVSLRSPLMLARVALVDPELTCDLPPDITASTGLDALTQLIEPYVCLRANPLIDGLCEEGIRRAARSLRVVCTDGRNMTAREDMAVASLFGGLALANAGLGAVHGIAGPLGGGFCAPHGAVCAALLPYVMEANIRSLREREPQSPALARYHGIARLLTGDPDAQVDAGVEWVRQLVGDLRIPPLGDYGVGPHHLTDLAAKAANTSSMKANPIALTPEQLAAILRRAL
jgi:alcohol dehydrogenase class IV